MCLVALQTALTSRNNKLKSAIAPSMRQLLYDQEVFIPHSLGDKHSAIKNEKLNKNR